MEVKNQQVPEEGKSDSFPYNFTVCLSTMFDFTNVLQVTSHDPGLTVLFKRFSFSVLFKLITGVKLQLVQSLEMLQILGVNRVVVYKTSCSPETQRILDYYTHTGGVWCVVVSE